MEYAGIVEIVAPRPAVWALLSDARQLAPCVPGLRNLEEVVADVEFRGVLTIPLGGRDQMLPAIVYWEKSVPPCAGQMRIRTALGKTLIDVASTIDLTETGAATEVRWTAQVTLPGANASLERTVVPMLQPLALRGIDEFFTRVKRLLETPAP